jgi:hypothetical protein
MSAADRAGLGNRLLQATLRGPPDSKGCYPRTLGIELRPAGRDDLVNYPHGERFSCADRLALSYELRYLGVGQFGALFEDLPHFPFLFVEIADPFAYLNDA